MSRLALLWKPSCECQLPFHASTNRRKRVRVKLSTHSTTLQVARLSSSTKTDVVAGYYFFAGETEHHSGAPRAGSNIRNNHAPNKARGVIVIP